LQGWGCAQYVGKVMEPNYSWRGCQTPQSTPNRGECTYSLSMHGRACAFAHASTHVHTCVRAHTNHTHAHAPTHARLPTRAHAGAYTLEASLGGKANRTHFTAAEYCGLGESLCRWVCHVCFLSRGEPVQVRVSCLLPPSGGARAGGPES